MNGLNFITSIPWDVRGGSGCYVGTKTLTRALRSSGVEVQVTRPSVATPVFTLTRILFNEGLRWRGIEAAATIGIDADGYAIPRTNTSPAHVACIKGVLGDAVRFERGITRASLAFHANLERIHARRADLVITISRYCAEKIDELYGISDAVVVPELIDLNGWRKLFNANPARPSPGKFTVLSVCRFYPRKRLDLLLHAARVLRSPIPELEIRIVGNGPEGTRLRELSQKLGVEGVVRWLGDVSMPDLAREYNGCDVFCLSSEQEGFGIVLLEAMAAGKPIVATRSAAIPEVIPDNALAESNNGEALAAEVLRLYRHAEVRCSLGASNRKRVEQFEMSRMADRFLTEVGRVARRSFHECFAGTA